MNPFVWIGIGIGLLLLPKRSAASPLLPGVPSGPPAEVPGTTQINVPIPAGWRRLTPAEVTPELASAAREILSAHGADPYGTLVPFGHYAGLIEQHYHKPGGPVKPWGFHHGVTLIVRSA